MTQKKILVWFRNDLRLHDHEALFRASQKSTRIFPLYCIDPRWFEMTSLGFPRTQKFRARFLLESLKDLRHSLRNIGSDLIIRIGHPERIIPQLTQQWSISQVFASKEVATEEVNIEAFLEQRLIAQGVSLDLFWQSTLYHLDDLPFPSCKLPDVFTDFRKAVEKTVKVRACFPPPEKLQAPEIDYFGEIPSLTELGLEEFIPSHKAVIEFKGGETAGLERLEHYFWKTDHLKNYKETRNQMLGANYSSKFSAWLSMGCLSPRKIYEEVKKYEKQRVKNESTYWLVFELLWRDYFKFVVKKYGRKIFLKGGIKESPLLIKNNLKLFKKWALGETGIPFIDAHMKELMYTGFMSNRGRQNVASFLVKDLEINWQWGARYFESLLIDYDVSSNWGNWNYVVGIGNDPRENRYFNILSQARRYDPQGEYIKYWLPQLTKIPENKILLFNELSQQELSRYGIVLGKDYPVSLIDTQKWIV